MDKEIYRSPAIDITFEGKRCIHSRMCVLGRPDVFVPNAEGAWIHPENATADALTEIAHSCPSGAIGYERRDRGAPEPAPVVNLIRLRENGPYAVHAPLEIACRSEGMRRTLCRCGASRAKPFCDGSHHEAGFEASGEPPSRESVALDKRAGPLMVTPLPDGPLKVDGALELVTGTGRTIDRRESAFLCRCGASASKPFCDGSHKRVGFSDAS